MNLQAIKQDQLPSSDIAQDLVGADHGGAGGRNIFVDAPPSSGPGLHKHPYEELFIPRKARRRSSRAGRRCVPALVFEIGDRVWWPSALGHLAGRGRREPAPGRLVGETES
jgi:hypothetical protein